MSIRDSHLTWLLYILGKTYARNSNKIFYSLSLPIFSM